MKNTHKNDIYIYISDKKVLHYEMIRIVAIFMVIFQHSENYGFSMFSLYPDTSIQFWLYLFPAIFICPCVALFLMVSGALMLPRKNESLSKLWKKVLRFGITLFVISVVYYLFHVYRGYRSFSVTEFFRLLYTQYVTDFLWYLYAYIAYLIALPILRTLVQNLEDKYFYYMIAIALITQGCVPVIDYFLWHEEGSLSSYLASFWFGTNIVLYPSVGYFLEHRVDIQKARKWILPLWILMFATMCIVCVITYLRGQIHGEYYGALSGKYFNKFTLLHAITLYITVKYAFAKIHCRPWIEKSILLLGGCSFGVYLLHMIVLDMGWGIALFNCLQNLGINSMICGLCMCLFVMLVSTGMTVILKKIPIVGKFI